MAHLQCCFHSAVLGYETQAVVVFPERDAILHLDPLKPYRFQVLYLLHGRGDDGTSWSRFTPIERYAKENQLLIVMPAAEESFYTDSVGGKKFFTYMTEELPQLISDWFPISDKPEDTFIAGLSMGGYGAMKIGFTYPERFGGIGAFSSVADIKGFSESLPDFLEEDLKNNLIRVFGDYQNPSPSEDPASLYQAQKSRGIPLPKLQLYIGTEDFLYQINQQLKHKLETLGADLDYAEWSGNHEWGFWDRAVARCLKEFPLKRSVLQED